MDVNTTPFVSRFLHEVNHIVKDAFDAFTVMILQVVALILHSIRFEILITIISDTVHDMSNTNALEYLIVFGNDITS